MTDSRPEPAEDIVRMTVRVRADGTAVQVLPDGTEVLLPVDAQPDPRTEAEIEAAAWDDPDNLPFTDDEWEQAPRVKK